MISTLLLAAAPFVAFPAQGAKLPAIDHVYLAGAVAKGDTNVVVNGANVPVYRTGAWATLIEATEGSNDVSVVSQSGEATNIWFKIAKKPVADPDAKSAPEKVWKKLDYAKDEAKEPPTNKAPNEVTIVVDKDANLLVAEQLKAALLARGYNVVMTRETDVFIPLYDRPKAAHTNDADAFVSIHHNAPPYDKNFAVTRNPEIPSCLVEVDFVTSPAGEEAIWNATRRRVVAEAIASGIDAWRKGPPERKEK